MIVIHNNKLSEQEHFSEDFLREGFSLYEVFRVFRGNVIFMHDNLSRLADSIRKSSLPIDMQALNIPGKLELMIKSAGIFEGNIKYVLHCTGGQTDEYIYQISHHYPTEEEYKNGVKVMTYSAVRDNAEVKYMNVSLREKTDLLMKDNHVSEVLLVNRDNCITEGSRSNVFFIRENVLFTAPLPHVLPGTSRKRVLEICESESIPVREICVPLKEIHLFEAGFLTGTSPLVLPICRIDRHELNPDHPLLRTIMEKYFSLLSNIF